MACIPGHNVGSLLLVLIRKAGTPTRCLLLSGLATNERALDRATAPNTATYNSRVYGGGNECSIRGNEAIVTAQPVKANVNS
jgi:hypothetical protein